MNLFAIFLTGLTTGGLSCLAMQGGLLASVIANQKESEKKSNSKNFRLNSFDVLDWAPVVMFLGAKLISHIVLGFLLGMLGSVITLSLGLRIGFQIFTAIFMFATAMNLLDVHPIFRYVVIRPPKFVLRLVRDTSKSRAYFTPVVLGVMTIFIPCGVTQAMEVLAINSGSPIQGALIMGSFVLGTSPLFLGLGVLTAKLTEGWYKVFTRVASVILILMAFYFVNGALIATDSPYAIREFPSTSQRETESPDISLNSDGQQEVIINAVATGYDPKYVSVKRGVPVKLTIKSENVYTCALYFVFREFGIEAYLEPTDSKSYLFTPEVPGRYVYSCSMGMYSGILEVI